MSIIIPAVYFEYKTDITLNTPSSVSLNENVTTILTLPLIVTMTTIINVFGAGVFVQDPSEFQAPRVARTTAQPGRDLGGQQTVPVAAAVDGHRRELLTGQPVRPEELATDAVRGPAGRLFGPEDPARFAVAGFGALRPAQGFKGQREYIKRYTYKKTKEIPRNSRRPYKHVKRKTALRRTDIRYTGRSGF